jgi:hypothetical protein
MKFAMFVKSDAEIEAGILPDAKLFAEMEKYNDELNKAGALITLDGLHPSSKGARVLFANGQTSVTDGPFSNQSELVAGYWIINAASKEEAVSWAKRVPFTHGVIEVRQIQEASEFPPEIQKIIRTAR